MKRTNLKEVKINKDHNKKGGQLGNRVNHHKNGIE